jgi:hypothetical protein
MQIFQITGASSPRIHVSETYNVFMKRFMSVCICCLVGTAAAMGPGGSSGTGGSSSSTGGSVLQPEVGISAIQVYNQGVDLMHAKKFAAARVKFEQAIQANPRFAEAHKNLPPLTHWRRVGNSQQMADSPGVSTIVALRYFEWVRNVGLATCPRSAE